MIKWTALCVPVCVGLFLSTGLSRAGQGIADTPILPADLHAVAQDQDCAQITDFYDRPALVGVPYVYGVAAGPIDSSAVFWCRRADRVWALMFATTGDAGMEYAGEIRIPHRPRGVAIFEGAMDVPRERLTDIEAPGYPAPQGALPRGESLEGRGVLGEHDGGFDLFVNIDGVWHAYRQQ